MLIASTTAPATPLHGTLEITQNSANNTPASITGVLSAATSPGVTFDGASSNRGDYTLDFPGNQDTATGVLLATVAENGRDNSAAGDPAGTFYPTTAIDTDVIATGRYSIAVTRDAPPGNIEFNVDNAFAWFPFDQWLAGHAKVTVDGGPITILNASPGIDLGAIGGFIDNGNGTFTLNLSGITGNSAAANGILLVNGGKNEDNYALSRAGAGLFTVYCHDNGVNGAVYEQDSVAFAYIPLSEVGTKSLVAAGRVLNDASSPISAGSFSVTAAGTGTWHLTVPGHSADTGTLLVSPEGGAPFNLDNTISYQWDPANNRWTIQSRDLTSYVLQSGSTSTEPMFSFAFFAAPLFVDGSASGANDGSSWADAYTTLQDALAAASPGDAIYVAEGSYYPDEGIGQTDDDRGSTFQLQSGVEIYGGFPAGGGNASQRSPAAHPTILSGDLMQDDEPGFANSADNAYHVLTGTGTNASALLDGFTITAGRADNPFNNRGGGLLNNGSGSATLANCSFRGNRASRGGAIHNSFASPTLTNCSFQGNSASTTGGAIENDASSPILTNCSFIGNRAPNAGGAICNAASSPILTNCSFHGNESQIFFGGAIYNEDFSSPSLFNCIIWNNASRGSTSDPRASVVNVSSSRPTYSHCLVQNWTAGQLSDPFSSLDGTDPSNNPRFVAEVDPLTAPHRTGGDLRLLAGSPAIDAGRNTLNSTSSDLAGNPRIANSNIDLGAFEQQGVLYVDDSASGASNGASWADAFPHLQDALAAVTGGQEIRVAAGSYFPDLGASQADNDRISTFQLQSGVLLLGGFPAGGGDLSQRDPAAHPTVLSGDLLQNDGPDFANNADNAYHVLTGTGSDANTLLDGFTITAGHANGSVPDNRGGGLYTSAGSPALTNCSFQRNHASDDGGAIFNTSSSPTFTNCQFQENEAAFDGGAIQNSDSSSPGLSNCLFRGNIAGSDGGAIVNSSSSPTLTNCSFQGNHAAERGGAIGNFSSSPLVTNCSFQGNNANFGGAISNIASSPSLFNAILWNNAEDGSTSAPGASVAGRLSNPTYSHCLVQNWTASALGDPADSLDGTAPANSPRFVAEVDPLTGPHPTGGDLRLLPGSPAIDAGLNSANSTSLDLAGNPRVANSTIDLGAFEQQGAFYVDDSASGASDGTSWTDAFPHLQDALAAAQNGAAIYVAEGLYYPDLGSGQTDNDRTSTFQLQSGVEIYGGFPAGGGDLSQRDPAAHPTVLSGDLMQNDGPDFANNADNAYHVLTGTGSDATALLDGFTITAGNANGSVPDNRGGGLYSSAGSPALTHCSFHRNNASVDGGAIYYNSSSSPTLTNCSFEENNAGSRGGAIYNSSSSPTLTNCRFQENEAAFDGGAIWNSDFSSPSLSNCLFRGNTAGFDGGAIVNVSSSPTLTNCSFQGNYAASRGGGGMSNFGSSPVLTNCSFQGNNANYGGAIFNSFSSPALTNCLLWNNAADGSISTRRASVVCSGSSSPTYSHCLIQNWTAAELGDPVDSLDGTDPANNPRFAVEVDPLTAPHATGGDLRLLPGSPAIDAGLNSANSTSLDLAGNARIVNSTIDLGAYEGAVTDPALLWPTDFDLDGVPWGVEQALGLDPDAPDRGAAGSFSAPPIDAAGHAVLTFGRNPSAVPGTQWSLTRSTILEPGSFIEIFRYDGTDITFTAPGISGELLPGDILVVTDTDNPVPRAFYRFDALYLPTP